MERKTVDGHARIAQGDPRRAQGFAPLTRDLRILPGDQLTATCDFDSTSRTVSSRCSCGVPCLFSTHQSHLPGGEQTVTCDLHQKIRLHLLHSELCVRADWRERRLGVCCGRCTAPQCGSVLRTLQAPIAAPYCAPVYISSRPCHAGRDDGRAGHEAGDVQHVHDGVVGEPLLHGAPHSVPLAKDG